MLILKPYEKVVIVQGCLRLLFCALFIGIGAWMATQFELGSAGFWMTAGVV
jgi:hypothetical protein